MHLIYLIHSIHNIKEVTLVEKARIKPVESASGIVPNVKSRNSRTLIYSEKEVGYFFFFLFLFLLFRSFLSCFFLSFLCSCCI
jgi:hypothetical protein